MPDMEAIGRGWIAPDVWQGLAASEADTSSLPKLGTQALALWLDEPPRNLVQALRLLHSEALDGDALVVAALGLPFQWAVAWGHSCVGSFAPSADIDVPSERTLRIVAEWTEHPSDRFAWEALRLAAIQGPSVPAAWLAQGLARLVHPGGLALEARQLATRFAILAAVGLAAADADAERFGSYSARLRLCAELALAVLGHV